MAAARGTQNVGDEALEAMEPIALQWQRLHLRSFTVVQLWPFSETFLVDPVARWTPSFDTVVMAVAAQGAPDLHDTLDVRTLKGSQAFLRLSTHHLVHMWPEPFLLPDPMLKVAPVFAAHDEMVLTMLANTSLVVTLFGIQKGPVTR